MSLARKLGFRYVAFAVLSTLANFVAQQACLSVYRAWNPLLISLVFGTGVGFVVKYVLDKFFIFDDQVTGAADEARKIVLYGVTALVTTLIFWSMELGCFAVGRTATWKYTGGALGLAMGYALKFQLDQRWVFLVRSSP